MTRLSPLAAPALVDSHRVVPRPRLRVTEHPSVPASTPSTGIRAA